MKAGAQSYSADFERETDYVGLYFMERAGFDTGGVECFWRRMAAKAPQAIGVAKMHPTTPDRFVTIISTRDQIRSKRAGN